MRLRMGNSPPPAEPASALPRPGPAGATDGDGTRARLRSRSRSLSPAWPAALVVTAGKMGKEDCEPPIKKEGNLAPSALHV